MPPAERSTNPYATDSMQEIERELHSARDIPGPMRAAICGLIAGGKQTFERVEAIFEHLEDGRDLHRTILTRLDALQAGQNATAIRVTGLEASLNNLVTGKVHNLEATVAQVQNDMKLQRMEIERATEEKLKLLADAYDKKLADTARVQQDAEKQIIQLQTETAVKNGQLRLMYVLAGGLLTVLGVVAAFLAARPPEQQSSPTPIQTSR